MSSSLSTPRALARPLLTFLGRTTVVTVLAAGLLAGCGASEDELTERGADLPSVTGVAVGMPEADDKELPVDTDRRMVEVSMKPDVGTKQILAVFDAYDDALSDDLSAVVVVLESPTRPRIAAAPGGTPTAAMVDAMLTARDDPDSERFTLVVDESAPQIFHRLRKVGFNVVAEHAEEHAAVPNIKKVLVSSENLSLALSSNKDEDAKARARAELVTVLDADFDVLEARVKGSGDLTVIVEPQSVPAATAYVNEAAADLFHGKVRIQG